VRYFIPTDWDAETGEWECYQIQWPKSPEWLAILNGLITQMMCGRTWNEGDGSIIGVQTIGRLIDAANIPLKNCAGETIITEYISAGGCGAVVEDDEMPCIDITSLIKIENGRLYVRNACCEWEDKGAFGEVAESVSEVILENQPGTPSPDACGKASAIVDAIYIVAQAMWDASSAYPWQWSGQVKDNSAGIDIKTKYAIEGCIDALALKTLNYEEEEVFDPITKSDIICKLVNSLDASYAPLTESEYDAIDTAFNQNMGMDTAIFGAAGNAIGKAQLSDLAQAGAGDSSQDCSCPASILDPTENWDTAWVYFKDFTKSQGSLATAHGGAHVAEYEAGKGWSWSDESNGYQDCSVDMQCVTPQAGATITIAWMLWSVPTETEYINTETTMQRQYLSQTILAQANMAGGDPSVGGLLPCQGIVSISGEAATWPIKIRMEADCPVITDKCYLQAIAFGGSGTSPFN